MSTRLKRFQKGLLPSGKEIEADITKDLEDQIFMKGSFLTQEEKDAARKHWKKTLWALKAADEFNYKSMH